MSPDTVLQFMPPKAHLRRLRLRLQESGVVACYGDDRWPSPATLNRIGDSRERDPHAVRLSGVGLHILRALPITRTNRAWEVLFIQRESCTVREWDFPTAPKQTRTSVVARRETKRSSAALTQLV